MVSHHGIVLYWTVWGSHCFITPYRYLLHDCYNLRLSIHIVTYCNVELNKSKVTYVAIWMYNKWNKNVDKNHNIKIDNKSFERVEDLRCLGIAIMNQYSIQEEIKSRLKSGNACCQLVYNLLSASLLSKSVKINLHSTIIFPAVLYVCYTWPLMLREVCGLRVFENRVLRRIFGPKKDEVTGEWERLHNEELSDLCSSPNIVLVIKSSIMRWARHVACNGRWEVCQVFGEET